MPTIRQNLEKGIKEKDWSLVALAYEALTGEKIAVANNDEEDSYIIGTKGGRAPRQAKLILPDSNVERGQKKPRKDCATEEIDLNKSKFNLYKDDLNESVDLIKVDRELRKKPKTPRTRETFSNVNIVCSGCNRLCEVHPELARKGYVCDRCISNARE